MDTAGLPEMDGAAAGHPGIRELGSDRELEPGRQEARSSETAAAAEAEAGQAEGLQAECCILQRGREEGRECLQFILQREKEREQLPFFFLNPNYFYSYQDTAYRTAAAVGEHLVAEAGIHLEPGTGTPDLRRQEQASSIHKNHKNYISKTKCEPLCITSVAPFILLYNIQMHVPQAAINPWCMGHML